jgi:hypothetical protein
VRAFSDVYAPLSSTNSSASATSWSAVMGIGHRGRADHRSLGRIRPVRGHRVALDIPSALRGVSVRT